MRLVHLDERNLRGAVGSPSACDRAHAAHPRISLFRFHFSCSGLIGVWGRNFAPLTSVLMKIGIQFFVGATAGLVGIQSFRATEGCAFNRYFRPREGLQTG